MTSARNLPLDQRREGCFVDIAIAEGRDERDDRAAQLFQRILGLEGTSIRSSGAPFNRKNAGSGKEEV